MDGMHAASRSVAGWRVRRQSRHAMWATLLSSLMLFVACASWATSAGAGSPGSWSDVTGATGTNLTQVGLVRGPGDVLHVAWVRESVLDPGKDDLVVTALTAAGARGAVIPVQSGWAVLNDPALLWTGAELQVFFGGIRSAYTGDPVEGLRWATSPSGSVWALQPGAIETVIGHYAYGSPVNAVRTPAGGGLPFFTWYGTPGVFVHRSTSSAAPDYDFHALIGGTCCGYYSNLGYDPVGDDLWLAWASNATGKEGVWVAPVSQATGAPAGGATLLPSSTTSYGGSPAFSMMLSKVPMTGRPAGFAGVFVAYPTGYPTMTRVRLWKLMSGAVGSLLVAGGSAAKGEVAVAADPVGRVWVVWSQRDGSRARVFARRSNATVTKLGAPVSVRTPVGTSTVYHLAAAAQAGRLNVLAHLAGSKPEATWHTQIKAGLTVSVKPAKIKVGKKAIVKVTVRDAGTALKGVLVRIGAKKKLTDSSGVAKLTLAARSTPGKVKVKVSKAGYTSKTVSLRYVR